jgi:hypothetical protein
MQLKEFKRSRSKMPLYSAVLADAAGKQDYELTISGNRRIVEPAFEKTDFEVSIDAHVSPDDFEAWSREFWNRRVGKDDLTPTTRPATVEDLFRKVPPLVAKNSVVVQLRRIQGQGTLWALFLNPIYVPAGASLFFVLPRVWTCWASVWPITGNADIFLSLGSPIVPPVRASTSLLAVDGVDFTTAPLPWTQFAAWFRVTAVGPGTPAMFMMAGHGIP